MPESPQRTSRAMRRAAVVPAIALAAALATGLAGCAKFNAALGQRWATVEFKANTSTATLLKVREACSDVPNVHPEALPRKKDPATLMYSLTYRTDNASDANLAQFQQCLQKFPSVRGITFADTSSAG